MRIDPRDVGYLYILDKEGKLKQIPLNAARTGNNYQGITLAEYEEIRKAKREQDKIGTIKNEELRVNLLGTNALTIAAAENAAPRLPNTKNIRESRSLEKRIAANKLSVSRLLEVGQTPVTAEQNSCSRILDDKNRTEQNIELSTISMMHSLCSMKEMMDKMKKIYNEKYEYASLESNEHQYDQFNLQESTCVDAVYRKSIVPEDNGNRFIEALPPPRSIDQAKLAYNIPILTYDYENERSLPSEQRELMLYRLRDVRFPLPHQPTWNMLCIMHSACLIVPGIDSKMTRWVSVTASR